MKSIPGYLLPFLLIFSACAHGAMDCTITVSTTIQAALRLAKAGDRVCVPDGTYKENGLWFAMSGTAEKPIVLQAINPLKAKIVGGIAVNKTSYVEITGFDLTSPSSVGIYLGNCSVAPCGHHVKIYGNYIHGCAAGGISSTHSDYVTIENNIVTNNAFLNTNSSSGISLWQLVSSDSLPGFHNVIRGNKIFGNDNKYVGGSDGNGIIIDDSQNTQGGSSFGAYKFKTLVESNLVYNNGGAGIHVFHSDYVTIQSNQVFANHTRVDASPWKGELSLVYSSNNTLKKNAAVGYPFNKANTATFEIGGTSNVWTDNFLCNLGNCK